MFAAFLVFESDNVVVFLSRSHKDIHFCLCAWGILGYGCGSEKGSQKTLLVKGQMNKPAVLKGFSF